MPTLTINYAADGSVPKQAIAFSAGEDVRLAFAPLSGSIDIAGWTLRIILADTVNDPPLIDHVAGDITVTSAGAGTFYTDLAALETFDFRTDVYQGEVRRVDSGHNTVLARWKNNVTANPLASGDAPALPEPPITWADVAGTPTTLDGYGITDAVPSARTLTINGVTRDLSASRSFTVGFYQHTQTIASATWTIAHNLGKFPSVTVVDSAGDAVMGDVDYVDDDNLTIAFSASFAGKAYLN